MSYCESGAVREVLPMVIIKRKKQPIISLVLSIIPGLGQIYNGQIKKGLIMLVMWFALWAFALLTLIYIIGFCLLLVPIVLWIYSLYDAFHEARKINRGIPSKDWL